MEAAFCNDDRATCPVCGTRLLGWDCLTDNKGRWFCDDYCADSYAEQRDEPQE